MVSKKGRLTMYCLYLAGTMKQCLLKGGVLKGKVNSVVFASCWDYHLVSAKGWCLKREGQSSTVCILLGL